MAHSPLAQMVTRESVASSHGHGHRIANGVPGESGGTDRGRRSPSRARSSREGRSVHTVVVRPRQREPSTYSELSRHVHALGLMDRRLGYYAVKVCLLAGALAGIGFIAVQLGDSWLQLLVAAALGLVLTQVAFLGHDAAHRQVFRSGPANDRLALVLANAVSGLRALLRCWIVVDARMVWRLQRVHRRRSQGSDSRGR